MASKKQTQDSISFPKEFENFIHNLPDALIEVDLATRQVTYMNGLANVLFGYEKKDIARGIRASKLFLKGEYNRAVEIMKLYALNSYVNKTEYIRSKKQEHYYFEMKKSDGTAFSAEVQGAFILDKNNIPTKLRVLIRDVTGTKQLSESHKRRGNILDAINYGTHLFLEKSSWGYYIQELVNRLGKATEVSRIYVFENHLGPNGELLTSQKYEWIDTGINAQLNNPDLQNFPLQEGGFGRWINTLEKGEIISGIVRDFPETEREILEPQEIISILIAPIFVSGSWWGFIGFDDCAKEREWSSTTKNALKTAADMIGTTLLRKQSEAALEESEKKYRLIIENMEEGYFELDLSGNFTFVNNAICKLSGYSREELLGMNNREYTAPETAKRMYAIYNKIYRTGKPAETVDYEIIIKDGSNRFLELSSSLIRDAAGQAIGFRGVARDVTERKQREDALKTANEQLKMLGLTLANMNESVTITNLDHQFIFVNKAFENIYGYSSEDILGKTADIIADPSSIKKVRNTMRLATKKGGWKGEIINVKKDGTKFPVELSTTPLKNDKGEVIAFIGISTDITERQEFENALRESEEELKSIVETTPDIIFRGSKAGVITYVSPKVKDIYGYDVQELVGKNFRVTTPSYEIPKALKAIKTILAGKSVTALEIDQIDKYGNIIPIEINGSPIMKNGRIVGGQGIMRNISKRKKAREEIQRKSNNQEQLLETARQLTSSLEFKEVLQRIGDQAHNLLKARGCDIYMLDEGGKNLLPVIAIETSHVEEVLAAEIPINSSITGLAIKAKKGIIFNNIDNHPNAYHIPGTPEEKNEHILISPFIVEGKVLGAMTLDRLEIPFTEEDLHLVEAFATYASIALKNAKIYHDLQQTLKIQQKMEFALRESEERFKQVAENAQEWIWEVNTDGLYTYASPVVKHILGYNPDEIVRKKHFWDLFHEKDRGKLKKAAFAVFAKKRAFSNFINQNVHKDGRTVWLSTSGVSILDEKGILLGYRGVDTDITERKRAEEEMQKLAAVVKHSSELVNLSTIDGKMIFLNESGGKMLGIEPHEVENVNIMEVIPDHLKGLVEKELIPALMKGGTWEGDLQYRNKRTGELTNVHATTFTIKNPDTGEPQFLANVSLDITARKQAEEKLKNYAKRILAINEASHTLASSLNLQTVVDRCIQIAKLMFDADDVVVFILDEDKRYLTPIANIGIYTEEVLAFRLKLGEGLTGSVAQRGEARIVNRIDLTEIGKQVPGTPVEPESLMSVPLKIKDEVIGVITLSKLGEQEFEEEDLSFIENLADISAVAIQNARLYEDVKQSEKLKTLFLANMSHEIRTPLTSIIGFSELIENSVRDKVRSEEHQFFDIIRNSSERLLRTVHNVLDMSKLEAMSFDLKPESIDLSELAEMVVAEHASHAAEKNLDLIYRSQVKRPTIKADKYCISQALSNLLDNAIKYTQKGCITVSLSEEDHQIILQVKDTGIGMTKKYQENLFDMFSQESTGYTKEFQGVGLGLALTRRYLDLNEIPITVTSKKNVGTTFTLKFPIIKKSKVVSKKEKAEIPSVEPPDAGTVQGCLLVVDDDGNAQRLFKYFLRESYQTLFAATVAEAKQQLKENEVDVILLDLSLIGNEDGLDLARYLRKTKRWKELPIIAVTAHAFTADRDNCLAAGCNDYISKPIKKPDLLEKIRQYV